MVALFGVFLRALVLKRVIVSISVSMLRALIYAYAITGLLHLLSFVLTSILHTPKNARHKVSLKDS